MSLWNAGFDATPSGSEDRSLGDDRMREIKAVLKERLIKEHNLDIAEAGSQPRQGLHKAGSAVIFSQADAPTLRNGDALGTADVGLVWHDTDDDSLRVWNGAAWVVIPGASLIADTAATPNRVLMRDTVGRGKVAAPAAADDIPLLSTTGRTDYYASGVVDAYTLLGTQMYRLHTFFLAMHAAVITCNITLPPGGTWSWGYFGLLKDSNGLDDVSISGGSDAGGTVILSATMWNPFYGIIMYRRIA